MVSSYNVSDVCLVQRNRKLGKTAVLSQLAQVNNCSLVEASEIYQHIEVLLRKLGMWCGL